jgi:seryl-tRNA synthetase
MLDPKIIRENPDKIRKMLKDRAVEYDFDNLIKKEKERRELIIKTDELREKRNEVSLEIGKQKKDGKDASSFLEEMKKVSQELEALESTQNQVNAEYAKLALTLPNLIHESVPIGKDASTNQELRKWGNTPQFDFKIQDHVDLSTNSDLVDLERAAKVAGARFYYLKNDLVRLNQALILYGLDLLTEKNYKLIQPPYMINRRIYQLDMLELVLVLEKKQELMGRIRREFFEYTNLKK